MGVEDKLTKRNMHYANLMAMVVIIIAWGTRFYYISKRETLVETPTTTTAADGTQTTTLVMEKVYVRDGFWQIAYTLVVFPVLILIFLVQEFQVQNERLNPICRHFYFLDYYIGKGFYLLLVSSLILQHDGILQWLVTIAVIVVVLLDVVHPCLMGSDPINGELTLIAMAGNDKTALKELHKAEAADIKKTVVKKKNPSNTARVKEETEMEGKSVVTEQSVDMNQDKKSGKGTLKVRFQVNSPDRKSMTDSKASFSRSHKTP